MLPQMFSMFSDFMESADSFTFARHLSLSRARWIHILPSYFPNTLFDIILVYTLDREHCLLRFLKSRRSELHGTCVKIPLKSCPTMRHFVVPMPCIQSSIGRNVTVRALVVAVWLLKFTWGPQFCSHETNWLQRALVKSWVQVTAYSSERIPEHPELLYTYSCLFTVYLRALSLFQDCLTSTDGLTSE
jgi:hypothetical protein